jgi:glycosyltransferase involved in cell wall biosynthesis
MKLGINGWRIHGRRTGVFRYLYNVVRHWTPEALAGRFDEVNFYSPRPLEGLPGVDLPAGIRSRVVGPHWRMVVWENLRLAPAAHDDVTWHPSYSRPLYARRASVVTVHDAIHEAHPELFPAGARVFYRHLYRTGARRATLVLTNSEAGKRDIVQYMDVPASKVRVVLLAPADLFRTPPPAEAARAAVERHLGGDTPFFLFVGKLSGRRSIPLLLEGFAEFKRRTRLPHRLALVGANVHDYDVEGMLRRWKIRDAVAYPLRLEDLDLNALYHRATALVSPGIHETMCLPAMEAQAAGAPVICADPVGTLEFTGGHAVALPEPTPPALGEALARVAEDAALREDLRARGREYSARFSWERTSRETLEVLAEASRMA